MVWMLDRWMENGIHDDDSFANGTSFVAYHHGGKEEQQHRQIGSRDLIDWVARFVCEYWPWGSNMLRGTCDRIIRRNLWKAGRFPHRWYASKAKDHGSLHIGRAGLPLILFCGIGVWVVANGIEGKNKERDVFQGRMSKYVGVVVSWFSFLL
jgi:hypothetical protein